MNENTRDKILYASGIILFLIVSIETLWLQLEIIEITGTFEGVWVVLISIFPMSIAYIIGLWIMSKTRHCWHTGEMNENASR